MPRIIETFFYQKQKQIIYDILPILYIFVPHVPHVPVTAGLPFFIVTSWASFISLFALHFTQYASIFFTSSRKIKLLSFVYSYYIIVSEHKFSCQAQLGIKNIGQNFSKHSVLIMCFSSRYFTYLCLIEFLNYKF